MERYSRQSSQSYTTGIWYACHSHGKFLSSWWTLETNKWINNNLTKLKYSKASLIFYCVFIAVSFSISITASTTPLWHCNKVNLRCSTLYWATVENDRYISNAAVLQIVLRCYYLCHSSRIHFQRSFWIWARIWLALCNGML